MAGLMNMAAAVVQAQQVKQVYGGLIVSEKGDALENVICQAMDGHKNIMDYTFSDQEGRFCLEKNDAVQYLQFKLLGYATLTLSKSQFDSLSNHTVKLSESSVPLEEVVVQVPPIQYADDTLRYNVSSFKAQGDRYVADVLKKLPGIKVNDNGSISYMGEAINKFYIEGRDLLGGQYNIATNNLDIDAVSAVEVLQHNQHIKALKGIDFEEKAAINLKLNKGHRARPFGEVQLGAGGTPFLYDGKGVASYMSGKQQALISIKGQNSGCSILNEIEDKLDINDLFSYEGLVQPFVTAPSARSVPLPTGRHLFNDTYLGSAHTLVPLSEDSELKLNMAYGHDRTDQDFRLLQSIAAEDEYIRLSELSKQKERTGNLRASVSYELNSLNRYVRDEVLYFRRNKDIRSRMSANEADSMDVWGLNAVRYVQNNFHGLFKAKGENAIHIHSLLRFESNKDELKRDRIRTNDISEWFRTAYFIAKNKISSSFNVLNNRLNIGLVAAYRQKNITNRLQYQEKERPEQSTKIRRVQIGLDPAYQIKNAKGNLFLSIKLPISYDRYSTGKEVACEKVIFSPSLSNTWQITHKWETFMKIGYGYDYADDISLLGSPYFSGYRSVYIPNEGLNHSSSIFLAGSVRHKDLAGMFFFNLNAIYRAEQLNYVNAFSATDEYSWYATRRQNASGSTLSLTADLSKTFSRQRLSLGLSPSYTVVKSDIFQQRVMTKNNGHTVSVAAKMDWFPVPPVNITYRPAGRMSWNNNNLTDTKPLKSLTQNLKIFYFPAKNIDLLLHSDYVIYEEIENQYSDFFFLDFKGTYRHKRMEYELALNNILNNRLFSISELSSVNIYHQQIPLRQREFLVSVRFNF